MQFYCDIGCDCPFCCSKQKQLQQLLCCLLISMGSDVVSLLILGLTDGHKFTKINADWKSKVTGSDCKTNIWAVKLQRTAIKCIDGHWIKHHLSKCVLGKKHADLSHKKMDVGTVNVWGGGLDTKGEGRNVTSFRRVVSLGGAVLDHSYDTVQLEHMISVDCLEWDWIYQPGLDCYRFLQFSNHFVSVTAELLI